MYPDFSNELSLHNWVDKMDLYCVEKYKLSLLGIIYFSGVIIGMIILGITKRGRRFVLIATSWLTLAILIFLMYTNQLYLKYIGMFFLGLNIIRVKTVFILNSEITMKKQQIFIACIILAFNSTPIFFATTYFKYISKDLTYYYYFIVFLAALNVVCRFLVPESPRYLYEKGEFDKARNVINKMARVNRSDMISENWLFKDEAPIEEQTGIQSINLSPASFENKQLLENNQEFDKEEIKMKMSPIKFMVKHPIVFKNLMIATIGWSCILMMMYYLNFAVKDIGRDIFTNSYIEATCILIGKVLFVAFRLKFSTQSCLKIGF